MATSRLARSMWLNLIVSLAFACLSSAVAEAQTQGGGAIGTTAAGDCLCGNENGTAFPNGQCFVERICSEALAETGGNPCTGVGQGNCPVGQYCLDASSGCGVPTCALQTPPCQGSCSVGTGSAPYSLCGAPFQSIPTLPPWAVLGGFALFALVGIKALRQRSALTTVRTLVLIGALAGTAALGLTAAESPHACSPASSLPHF